MDEVRYVDLKHGSKIMGMSEGTFKKFILKYENDIKPTKIGAKWYIEKQRLFDFVEQNKELLL